jgi:M61 glycyl aminopeptidase
MRNPQRLFRAHPTTSVIAILICAVPRAGSAATQVIVEKTGSDQVTVRYQLSDAVTELVFAADAPVTRADYWKVDGSVDLRSDRAVSDVPFTEISATLRPNDRFIDRVYASLFTIDSSTAVVNLDFIRLDDSSGSVTMTVRNAYDPYRQACVRNYEIAPAASAGHLATAGRYVMLSDSFEDCRAQVEQHPDRIFFSSGLSPVIADTVTLGLRPAYRELREQFGVSPEPEPTVFLSHDPFAVSDTFQGDAGWHSVISLRFYGDAWNTPDDDDGAQILSFLTHELVHAWIGELVRIENPDGKGDAWLHEGAAEYIALLTLARQGRITRESFREQIASRFTDCGHALDFEPLMSGRRPQGGRIVYDCGVLVQFVYDVVGRFETGEEGSVVDLWRELIDGPREDWPRTIEAGRFIDSNAEAARVLSGVLYGPRVDTTAIAAALTRYGVDSVTRENTDPGTIAAHLVFPILHADCQSGSIGFWTNADHLALDANETCASVPAGFVLRRVEAVDLLEQPGAAYAAAARACAGGGWLQLAGRTPEEPELRVRCPGALPAHPVDVEIRAIGFLEAAP